MFLYWSTWHGTGTSSDPFAPDVFTSSVALGGLPSVVDLRSDATQVAGRALVGSDVLVPVPTPPSRFLLDTAVDLDNPIPAAIVNAVNTQLGTSVPQGRTWREAFNWLMTREGPGRWGVITSLRLRFGAAGEFDL